MTPSTRFSAASERPRMRPLTNSPRGGLGGLSRTAARLKTAELLAGPGDRPKCAFENGTSKIGRLFSGRATVLLLAILLANRWPSRVGAAGNMATEPYEWKSVTIGANGFINGIVYGPAAGTPCYINTDMGGAYRLDAAKNEWVCLTDWIKHDDWSLNQMGVETLAVDPSDPNSVYAGVGTYMGPSAVIRSSDQGRTWRRTNVPFPMNGNGLARNSGQRMNVDPNLPARLLYGTRTKGLFESVNHGETWAAISNFLTTGESAKPAKDCGVVWTLFDKSSGQPGAATPVAYAGVCTTQADKIFRTTDGTNWRPIPGQPGGRLLPTRAALSPDGQILFATFVTAKEAPGPFGVDGGKVYSCDGPASAAPIWTDITPAYPGGGGWSGICLDPKSPATLYVSTIDHYAAPGDDIFRSRDGGHTWSPSHIGRHRDDRSAPYVKDSSIHWTGDVQVNPHDANEAMFTTGYGLYRTTNLADAEPTWTFYNSGFEQSAVLKLVSPPSGSAHLLSAIGDRDGYRHEDFSDSPKYGRFGQPNEFGQTKSLTMGTCNDLAIAAAKPDICVRVGDGAQLSEDGGVTWRVFGNPDFQPRGGSIAIAADGGSVVWDCKGVFLMRVAVRNADGWTDWTATTGVPPTAETIVVADAVTAGTFYAVARDVTYVSVDKGHTFTAWPNVSPAKGHSLCAAPGRTGHLWMTAGEDGRGGLWRSVDGGKSWDAVAPKIATVAKQVALGAPPPGKDYPAIFIGGTCGDARGFFRSDDEGATWVRINDDQHQYGNVTVIAGDPRVFGRLYVGTNGRGILYATPATKP